jgi:Carboxypeptidase regulatory-like domain
MKRQLLVILVCALFVNGAVRADDRAAISATPVPSAGNVTIPLEEYNHLIELASRPARKAEVPPLPYVLKRADLKLSAVSDCVAGKIHLEGEVFNKGVTKVPLATGLTVFDAQREGKSLPLLHEGATHVALLPGDTSFNVTLDAGLPLTIDAGRASFTLPVPSAGSVSLTLVVPGDRTSVKIHPGLITSQTSDKSTTTVEVILQPGQPAEISWATREIIAPVTPREVRFLSDLKILFTVSEGEVRVAALADVNVLQGEPDQFEIELPSGYEMTAATGGSIDSTEEKDGVLIVRVTNPAQHSHQFLITLEESINTSSIEAPFLAFKGTQRETGEILVEGAGTIELTASENDALKRMDLKEINPLLRSMARNPMQAAFRYHRQPGDSPRLALQWTRFPDSSVLAAVVERAIATTLVTNEGKSLTEIKLTVKNQAQPFLKLDLPAGASILSAEVGGEKVKPVEGADGTRLPLLRPGFRPVNAYEVTFVYLHSGAPFAKKGGSQLDLPRMDVPIDLLQWEVFLPEQYKVKEFGGDAIPESQLPPGMANFAVVGGFQAGIGVGSTAGAGYVNPVVTPAPPPAPVFLLPGQLGGYIMDSTGAAIPNARVTVVQLDTGGSQVGMTDDSGHWIANNLPSGRIRISASANGFQQYVREFNYDASRPSGVSFGLNVGSVSQTVEVTAGTVDTKVSRRIEAEAKKRAEQQQTAASANVTNFQRKVAGVLPIRVEVPRAGNSYRFVRPLVLDEETKLTFAYKTK